MEWFDRSGHLTDSALRALAFGGELPELDRLELSEHLDYCDQCLTRFTALLTEDALLTPERSCRDTIWTRIRRKTLRVLTSRYATAAAAIVIVATMWSFNVFGGLMDGTARLADYAPPAQPSQLSQRLGQFGDALNDGFARFSDLFTFGAVAAPQSHSQGGNQP